ncbi:hypothetical protein Nepgr_007930 [Nepenthes gracilis]|uniref:Uncharacterized protein n=1 Tax=Nepenthes gracilis TaxID=150966 RepID=A0AAD3XIX2_NEPGR|nr:hypothetical protein Nepgr_007930 [Nepenthes gracilis]
MPTASTFIRVSHNIAKGFCNLFSTSSSIQKDRGGQLHWAKTGTDSNLAQLYIGINCSPAAAWQYRPRPWITLAAGKAWKACYVVPVNRMTRLEAAGEAWKLCFGSPVNRLTRLGMSFGCTVRMLLTGLNAAQPIWLWIMLAANVA